MPCVRLRNFLININEYIFVDSQKVSENTLLLVCALTGVGNRCMLGKGTGSPTKTDLTKCSISYFLTFYFLLIDQPKPLLFYMQNIFYLIFIYLLNIFILDWPITLLYSYLASSLKVKIDIKEYV